MSKTTLPCNPAEPVSAPLSKVETTTDTLTGRGRLALFSRYVRHTGIYEVLERYFGPIRRSAKGIGVSALFHQIAKDMVDGTSRHLVYFDALAEEEGYARTIETEPEAMASSHQVKRFFAAFRWGRIWTFRHRLRRLVLWQLKHSAPEVVVLGLDPMVLDNDTAEAREGCQPTYKKRKGFQPLQLTWGPFVIDALFRGGKKNGNAGEAAAKMVETTVRFIRKHYREDVPIVVRTDSGFFDQKLFRRFERLGIGYTCTDKLYEEITARAEATEASAWSEYTNDHQQWQYLSTTLEN